MSRQVHHQGKPPPVPPSPSTTRQRQRASVGHSTDDGFPRRCCGNSVPQEICRCRRACSAGAGVAYLPAVDPNMASKAPGRFLLLLLKDNHCSSAPSRFKFWMRRTRVFKSDKSATGSFAALFHLIPGSSFPHFCGKRVIETRCGAAIRGGIMNCREASMKS